MEMTAAQLAGRINAKLQGDASLTLTGCATLEEAGPNELSFLANPKYATYLKTTRAGAVILAPDDASAANDVPAVLITENPYLAFRSALLAMVGPRQHPNPGISDKADIDSSATVGKDCYIGPFVSIAPNATVGDRCVIYPHCYVGPNAKIGDDCVLFPSVTIYNNCVLHNRVTLHAGCSVGQDGFGYVTHAMPDQPVAHHKIPQVGNVVIEDDVELGANCSVDRAALGSTIIGQGTKFSDSVTIGHGTKMGKHNLIVAQVGIAGSVTTGDYVVMGGQVGIAGHLKINDAVQIAAQSGVASDLPAGQQFGGAPAIPLADARRQVLTATRLPEMRQTLRQLQQRITKLEQQLAATEKT